MHKSIRLTFLLFCTVTTLLQGCSGVRLATLSETLDGFKKQGKNDLEKQCDQYTLTSIEYQNCRQNVRKIYDELDRKQKADDDKDKLNKAEPASLLRSTPIQSD
jgi:hypothetical protein